MAQDAPQAEATDERRTPGSLREPGTRRSRGLGRVAAFVTGEAVLGAAGIDGFRLHLVFRER